jgi:hypothetical protein
MEKFSNLDSGTVAEYGIWCLFDPWIRDLEKTYHITDIGSRGQKGSDPKTIFLRN